MDIPLAYKNSINMHRLYDRSVCKVAVNYCVLRPQTKDNT